MGILLSEKGGPLISTSSGLSGDHRVVLKASNHRVTFKRKSEKISLAKWFCDQVLCGKHGILAIRTRPDDTYFRITPE